jgi:hypothetical protein
MEIGVISFKVMILLFLLDLQFKFGLTDFGADIGNNYGLNG